MTSSRPLEDPKLPLGIKKALDDFLKAARESFGDQLRSVTLFGSAAEGKLHATSDINLIVVLSVFEQARADQLCQPLRIAQAAFQLRPMFILESEIPEVVRCFAPKFADILRRRVILYGDDAFAGVHVPRDAAILQLKQQLLNITLRLRTGYVVRSLREEQLAVLIAEVIGPASAAAATVLELEGRQVTSPRDAFSLLGLELNVSAWSEAYSRITTIQGAKLIGPGEAQVLLFQILEFIRLVTARVELLIGEVRSESL